MELARRAWSVPDSIRLWPFEDGRFGLDATYAGASGYDLADVVERDLRMAGAPVTLVQGLGGEWTVRLGPITSAAALAAVESFLTV